MGGEFHRVTQEELPTVLNWLEKYLPDSSTMHGAVLYVLKGKWRGVTFHTLGWPGILAVAQSFADPATSLCPKHDSDIHNVCVFSPHTEHLEILLNREELFDWTHPILFQGISQENSDVVQRVSEAKGSRIHKRYPCVAMTVEPEDFKLLPVPEGYEARQLEPHLHAEYVTSTWPHRTKHSVERIRALIEHLPAMGLFDRDGNPTAVIVTVEWGFPSFLHVKEEARGRGLGACVASLLAWKLLQENGRVMCTILRDNELSIKMHRKIGYKPACGLDWFLHSMTDEKLIASQ